VIGYLALWGVHLDQICMITITMSIGLTIDYSSHIVYGYAAARHSHARTGGHTAAACRQAVVDAITALATPVCQVRQTQSTTHSGQGCCSTLLGVVLLATIDCPLINVFAQTVFLVVMFGMVHALILLPILLDTVMPFLP
jgi:predicted RND superfamily exporter protein